MRQLFITAFLFFLLIPGICAEIEFTAAIDAETIGLEDYLIYTITFKGIQNPSPPDISALGDFNVIQTSRSSEFKFINGASSSYINFIYYLAPLKEGTLIIPPVRYIHNNKVLKTQQFRILAVKGSIKKVTAKKRRRSIFDLDEDLSAFGSLKPAKPEIDVKLKALVSKSRIKPGEQLIYRVLLYSRNRIESVNLISGQSFPGFWQEWYPVKKSIDGTTEIIDGKNYHVFEIRKAALFPSETGDLSIPSIKFELSLSDNSMSFFSSPRKITRSTKNLKIRVDNDTGNLNDLPVGKMSISAEPDKSSIDISELVTIKVIVRGYGNIKTINIPEYENNIDYKIFPAKISRKINYKEKGIYGVVSAEVPVSFNKTGNIKIPSLEFRYYDPDKSKIVTERTREFIVEVSGNREEFDSSVIRMTGGVSKKGSDIDFIIKGEIGDQKEFIYRSPLFRIIIFLIFVFILSIPVYEYIIKIRILDSRKFQKKRVLQDLIRKLDNVKEYEVIFQVLEEYLEKKTGIGRSKINNTRIGELFYSLGIGKNETDEFLRIRMESELSRFSRSTIKTLSQIREEVSSLKKIIKIIDPKLK
ncbi:MAG: BatD family protein [Acidobacteriota bacterium]